MNISIGYMRCHMIEIYLLEQLTAFAKHGTLSKAAEELHISQPALSRSMKKLETDLGVTLFIRENKKLLLNETGKLAAALAQSQVDQNREMIGRIVAFDRNLHSIHIGACAPQPMAQLMPTLQAHFGDMTISSELVYGEKLINGLKNGTYHLAILQEAPDNETIFCQRYIDESLFVTLPEKHRLAKRKSVSFKDLAGEKFLLYQHIGFWESVCEDYMKDTTFLIQPDRDTFFDLVLNTDYPSFASDAVLVGTNPIEGRVAIPLDEEKAHFTFYIACKNEDKKKYSAFFNSVRSEVLGG